ncbi:MAG TPA: hypothetical protein VNY81_08455 [Candidatus Saccharimonadales bacterium]|jgi:hypothetical protein|nr:hypothetical protein [Candidatus Saccharimonadales bacterium]
MSSVAKWYIALVTASGTVILFLAARWWSSANLKQFAVLVGLTFFASTLKVRIPGMTGTISPNFAFLLIAMTFFAFSQTIAAALAAAIVQSFWKPQNRPRMVQVLFNAAALVLSSAFAFGVSHLIVRPVDGTAAISLALLAGTLYFSANTGLVSIVVGLAEQQPVRDVCQRCYEWVFPYFVFGIVVTGLISGSFSTANMWRSSLQIVPAMVLAYLYFLGRSKKQAARTWAS